jgi:hypothetical protein
MTLRFSCDFGYLVLGPVPVIKLRQRIQAFLTSSTLEGEGAG